MINPRNYISALRPAKRTNDFQFATWDIEAFEWWNLQCVGFYDGQDYFSFKDIGAFLEYLIGTRKYRGWRIFAHFGGRYDLNFVFDFLRNNPGFADFSFITSGSCVISMTIRRGRNRVRLCDSFRLLPAKLADITKAFGRTQKDSTVDRSALEKLSWAELIEYNRLDCISLWEVLDEWFKRLEVKAETLASSAMTLYRAKYQAYTLFKPAAEVESICRESYHGGRVEVYKRAGNVNYYDVNSMYPWAMIQPVPVHYICQSNTLKEREHEICFVDATVNLKDCFIPPLPVYAAHKLLFPVGQFRGIWLDFELARADSSIVKIHRVWRFASDFIFNEYVAELYRMKQNSGEPERTIAKLLLNSLYGKFGQQPEKKCYVPDTGQKNVCPILQHGGKPSGMAYYKTVSRAGHLLVHIASAITARARVKLYDEMIRTDPHYCDTDSIFTTSEINSSRELGEWFLQGTGAAEFFQPKLYCFDGVWRTKGLPRGTGEAFVKKKVVVMERTGSILEAIRKGGPACRTVTVSKTMRDESPKREWIGDSTRPWKVKDGKLT